MPLKILSLFSGIGAYEKALNRLHINFDLVGFSEIDKWASKSYCAIHHVDPSLNLGDATKIDERRLPDFDVLVGSAPCQAFSVAGKRLGFKDTRGTLFFDLARIAKEKKPKIIVSENVKGLVNHDKGKTLTTILQVLSDIGYTVDFKVLNSKYFGIPQSRERVYIIALRNDLVTPEQWVVTDHKVVGKRKSALIKLGTIRSFNFPWSKVNKVTSHLKDVLQTTVDEKYYLSKEKTSKAVLNSTKHNNIDSPYQIGDLNYYGNDIMNRVYNIEGICPTLTCPTGGGRQGKIIARPILNKYHICRLTPLECWRLMGFDDEDFDLANKVCSDNQLYKQAGNSIVVNVLESLFSTLINKYLK